LHLDAGLGHDDLAGPSLPQLAVPLRLEAVALLFAEHVVGRDDGVRDDFGVCIEKIA
jgi:hypothetical protein